VNADRPIFWHQGLFLQPQHLQLNDRYQSSLVTSLIRYAGTHLFGVADLQIQASSLANQQFEILKGEFIFPDGTPAVFPGNTVIKPRSFDGAWQEAGKPFPVYLGLRKWSANGENVTVVSQPEEMARVNSRFATTDDPDDVNDHHGKGPPAKVKRLNHVVRLFWETERDMMDEYSLIPIAQLERDGGEIRLSRHFVPPSLTMAASEKLLKTLKDIRDQVSSRSRQLEQYKSTKEVHSLLLALYALNRNVPVLNQLNETKDVHPWVVYGTLRQLVGELSTFVSGRSATGEGSDGTSALPPYNHQNCWPCFSAAHQLIGRLLEGLVSGPEHLIRMDFDGNYYNASIPKDLIDPQNAFWLVLQTESNAAVVKSAVGQVVKLATSQTLPTLIARALPGISLSYHPGTPPGLPQRTNTHFFRIDTNSRLWAGVEQTEGLLLYWDRSPADLVAEIIVAKE
jgi:type VI secretion system protein ImpJ